MQTSRDTVLIIDDSKTQLDMVSYYLEDLNTIVLTAQSGEEGIEIAKKRKPDIILLDINMPKMDGYETCARLKADADLAPIPVILVSATADLRVVDRAEQVGAAVVLPKPVPFEQLQHAVSLALDGGSL